MSKIYDEITSDLQQWISEQRLFFVATAPTGGEQGSDGHINCSPKGLDSLRVLRPRTVAYLDLTGSGAETIAHLRENGRICLMFCAFEGSPKIVRLHGHGEVITPADTDWQQLVSHFPPHPTARSIIRITCERISDSCGFGVPRFEYAGDRETLSKLADQGADAVTAYQQRHNLQSIDGLPALDPQ
ncbi:MAG: pyridoxamine 5'-phosphate oxidase family protein [Planctomycetota bacterium]